MKMKNDAGEEVEVSQAEFDAKVAESVAAKSVEIETKFKGDLEAAQQKLKEAEEAAAKGGGDDTKDENIKNLRTSVQTLATKLEEVEKNRQKEIDDLKSKDVTEVKTEGIIKLSKGDAEVKKQMEFYWDQFKTPPTTKAEATERLQKVYMLATGNKPTPGLMDSFGGMGGNRGGQMPTEGATGDYLADENENSKAIRKVMGISDEDAKKFGKN